VTRVLRWLLGVGALAVLLLLADARPAAADNCSGLSDCYFVSKSAVTVTVGIGTVAVVLLLTPPVTGSPDATIVPKGPSRATIEATIRPKGGAGAATERGVVHLPRARQKLVFQEEALAAGRQEELKALRTAIARGAAPEEWVRAVNPAAERASTLAAVNAVDAALGKVPRLAKRSGALTPDAIAAVHDSMVTEVYDLHEIGQFLDKAGPGARGVVTVQLRLPASWANAASVQVGHAFNAANVDGRVIFVDPQTATVAPTPHDILTAAGHDPRTITSVQFVPTHPTLG